MGSRVLFAHGMWYWKNVSMVKNMFSQPRWPPGLSMLFMSAESISGSMDV